MFTRPSLCLIDSTGVCFAPGAPRVFVVLGFFAMAGWVARKSGLLREAARCRECSPQQHLRAPRVGDLDEGPAPETSVVVDRGDPEPLRGCDLGLLLLLHLPRDLDHH